MAVNRYYSNTAVETTLSGGINNSVTSIVVGSVSGFPVSFPYTLVIDQATASEELVTVTAAAGTTLTVTRGSDSTSAVTHSAGAAVKHVASARDFREPQEHIDSTAAHGATGAVMGTTNTQTVTNKNLTSETNLMPNSVSPVGGVQLWTTNTAPTGWLLCDGTAVNRTTYAALFAVIGTTYGTGDGSTTFNLPNFKGRIPVGRDAAQTEFDTLNETGGSKTHTLSASEMPSHTHDITHGHSASSGTESADHAHSGTTGGGGTHNHGVQLRDKGVSGGGLSSYEYGFGTYATDTSANGDHGHAFSTGGRSAAHTHAITVNNHSGSSGSAGSGAAHNNLQPYIVVNYIIKV